MRTKSQNNHHPKVEAKQVISAAGGPTALARELEVCHQAINFWKEVPPARVLDCERITGYSRYQIRPDIFGDAPPSKPIRAKKVA